jgi:uncharacterized protein YhaN
VKNLEDINIFYGENEAGKSTIMSFIHSVLFGFPTRTQSELRYEPKKLTKYGGQLVVTFPRGKAVIERVKGKATGEVKVMLEDGTQGGEELLQNLLSQMDKSLYQSIFSFNLHGLQNVQQMKSEDLGKFLFSTGALGTDRLLATENTLQKELDSRYKPNGKKPLLNEQIAELKILHQDLKKAEQHNDQYWLYLEERDRLEQTIQSQNIERINKQSRLARLQEWQRYVPLMNEQLVLTEEISQMGPINFPDEGIRTFEELQREFMNFENRISKLISRINEVRKEIDDSVPNDELLENELEIFTAVENLPLYEQLSQESKQLELELNECQQEMEDIGQRLHFKMNEEKILNSNTSFFMKERTATAQRLQLHLTEKKQELDEQFQQTKKDLEEFEKQIDTIKSSFLSELERKEMMTQKSMVVNRARNERELADVRSQIRMIKGLVDSEVNREKARQHQQLIGVAVLGILFVFLAFWSFLNQQWAIFSVAVAGLLYIVIFQRRKPMISKDNFQKELMALSEKEKLLDKELSNSKYNTSYNLEQRLEEDDAKREQSRILQIKWDQKNEQYERILMSYEQWELESREHHQILDKLGKDLGIPKEIALNYIHDAYLLIEKLKNVFLKKNKLKNRKMLVQSELFQIEERIKGLASRFLATEVNQLHNAAYLLKQALKKEQEQQILHQEKCQKLVELENDFKECQQEKEKINGDIKKLYQLANVDSEIDFREMGELSKRRTLLSERLTEIHRQLLISGLTQSDEQELNEINNLEQQISQIQNEQHQNQEEIVTNQERLAKVNFQISLLEEGGTYAELLHQYKLKQSQLNIEAKTWAKYALAKDLLSQAVERYKNERLPKMIERAESFLRELTENHYTKIHIQKEGSSLLIESKDHIFYEPRELSQATSEQIYVALRLALATTLYEKYQFPIIIDDSFVNFDHNRTRKVVKLLSDLEGHQILFFTCHHHLLQYFDKGKVIKMAEQDRSIVQL